MTFEVKIYFIQSEGDEVAGKMLGASQVLQSQTYCIMAFSTVTIIQPEKHTSAAEINEPRIT